MKTASKTCSAHQMSLACAERNMFPYKRDLFKHMDNCRELLRSQEKENFTFLTWKVRDNYGSGNEWTVEWHDFGWWKYICIVRDLWLQKHHSYKVLASTLDKRAWGPFAVWGQGGDGHVKEASPTLFRLPAFCLSYQFNTVGPIETGKSCPSSLDEVSHPVLLCKGQQ